MKNDNTSETMLLNFHKAFYKVISPILAVVQALIFLSSIGHLVDYDSLYDSGMLVINLLVSGASIILLCLITYGFAKGKEFAWYMVYAYLSISVLLNIISATQADNGAVAVGQIVGALIIPTLIGAYYYKRKSIFIGIENDGLVETTTKSIQQTNVVTNVENKQVVCENEQTINYCRKCGNRVVANGVFCHQCGSRIDWN